MNTKRCPICGANPTFSSSDMGRGNGHGYPGNTDYRLECKGCGMIRASADDIYDDIAKNVNRAKAPERVAENWNERCLEIEGHLKWRQDRESLHPFAKELVLDILRDGNNTPRGHLSEKVLDKLIAEVEKL